MGQKFTSPERKKLESLVPVQDTILRLAQDQGYNPSILDLGDRQGDTDYIDFVSPEEMTSSIMYGTDCHQRPFVSLLLERTPQPETQTQTDAQPQFVITAFQRYRDCSITWCVGGPYHWVYFQQSTLDIVEKCKSLFAKEPLSAGNGSQSICLSYVRESNP
jgi:hypothetical protein